MGHGLKARRMPNRTHGMAMSRKLNFFYFTLLLIGMGCQHDPRSWDYTTKRPQEKDLIGSYKLDPNHWQNDWYKRKGFKITKSILNLGADGSFSATSVPDCWYTHECSGKLENLKGIWLVGKDHQPENPWWVIYLNVVREGDPNYEKKLTEPPGLAEPSITLMNNKPPYILHFVVGDPDSGDGLSYTKQNP
jgi:hypothetical protein